MDVNFISVQGEVVRKGLLKLQKARDIANAVERMSFFELVECRRSEGTGSIESVIFDVDVEVGQYPVHDILPRERIAVLVFESDDRHPEVLALREDFPLVPHLNLRDTEIPRSLCLFEESYSELRLRWSASMFLERIRYWLHATSRGELHADDQRLEPLLVGTPTSIIIPFDLFSKQNSDELELLIIRKVECGQHVTFFANRITDIVPEKGERRYLAISLVGEPQIHGIINRIPADLAELHDFLLKAQISLLDILREKLKNILEMKPRANYMDFSLVLIISLPKKRQTYSAVEACDVYAFLISITIKDLGEKIGIWDINGGIPGLLLRIDCDKKGIGIPVHLLNPIFTMSKDKASKINGILPFNKKCILIGAGALGSQVFGILVRMGFGYWTVIDKDTYLPHNAGRHLLPGNIWGESKAEMVALFGNSIIDGKPISETMVVDMLNPMDAITKLNEKIIQAELIIDASTSIPVARSLVKDYVSNARRVSIFLCPSGYDSVILAEDEQRSITLDLLEMQYYRLLISSPELSNHLQSPIYPSARYGRSCRDVSSVISQDFVALHAAICSRAIREITKNTNASITIWRANDNDSSIARINLDPEPKSFKLHCGEWWVYYDQKLIDKILDARTNKLPVETGGILVGSYDMVRKIVYIVDTILSPSDSVEQPTLYIRGCKGLKEQVEEIERVTDGMLSYIGEWHSHPTGCNSDPSSDDAKVFTWLEEVLGIIGTPPIMLIVADHEDFGWFVEKIN